MCKFLQVLYTQCMDPPPPCVMYGRWHEEETWDAPEPPKKRARQSEDARCIPPVVGPHICRDDCILLYSDRILARNGISPV